MIRFARGENCLLLPPDAQPAAGPPPAIVFLHGIGERGSGGEELGRVRLWGLAKLRSGAPSTGAAVPGFPFLVVAPQCPATARWCDDDVLAGLAALVAELVATGEADPQRLAIAGFSMGGVGTFCAALRAPGRFGALISVCGACEQPERLPELAHLPMWVAWAEDDEIGHLTEGSRHVVQALQGSGAVVARPYRLGALPDAGAHVRTADAAFAEPELYPWLSRVLATGARPAAA